MMGIIINTLGQDPVKGHKIRRDTLKNLKKPATNFYVWFGTLIIQENQFQSIPPYFIALVQYQVPIGSTYN